VKFESSSLQMVIRIGLRQIAILRRIAWYYTTKQLCRLTGLNSRVPGHGIRIVLYALVRLLTVVVLLKYVTWSIYTETDVPLISQCFVIRGLVRQQM
jgi:hypothetical protein